MLNSMTAYAEETRELPGLFVSVEMRTYNSRYLDYVLKLPGPYRYLENPIKQAISSRLERGRVEASFLIKDERHRQGHHFTVDQARAAGFIKALQDLSAQFGLAESTPGLDLLARTDGIIQPEDPPQPDETEERLIQETLTGCLESLVKMRQQEGQTMATDLLARIDGIETMVTAIGRASETVVQLAYDRLKERLVAILDNQVTLDENRIAQEAALMADKSDISEEIVRAQSHIQQFRQTIRDGGACGRKLNFLLQEFNREFNTMGAKTGLIEVSENVVKAKTELEKIREQVQNIE